jgi:hypothetical protein
MGFRVNFSGLFTPTHPLKVGFNSRIHPHPALSKGEGNSRAVIIEMYVCGDCFSFDAFIFKDEKLRKDVSASAVI